MCSTAAGRADSSRSWTDHTLAFADYRGNRQYISTGNLQADGRSA